MKAKIKSFLLAIGVLLFAFCLLLMPTETVEASKQGLTVWVSSVFPSLLPFFIIAELLIQFGVVRFVGVLFEPIMKPLFNVPGVGSFIWAIGMASGFPTGATFTAKMRQENLLTKIEAERLIAFTNASNPIFIIAVISVSFLKTPKIGIILVLVHYLSNLLVGLLMRFYKREKQRGSRIRKLTGIWQRAFRALHQTRIEKQQPIGKTLGNAVMQSIETLLMIGGFMIIFSVISTILIETGVLSWISQLNRTFFLLFKMPDTLLLPFSVGLFEITMGAQQIAAFIHESLLFKVILISILLAFNGLSVHAQVASILADTDIRYAPYFWGRILQAFFSTCLILIIYPFIPIGHQIPLEQSLPVQGHFSDQIWSFTMTFINQYGGMITLITLWLGLIIFSYRVIQSNKKSR